MSNEEQNEEQNEERPLTVFEVNWALHQYCGIPYHEAKKIQDPEEKNFLISMAASMKALQEEQARQRGEEHEMLSTSLEQAMGLSPNKPSE